MLILDIAMPKLDLAAAHEFWKNYDDPMIYRVISFMETAEDWTLDGNPELEQALAELGQTFDEISRFELSKEEQFVAVCSHIRTSRILRLLQAVDTIDPGSASKLLMFAEENNSADNQLAGLFLRRNIIFERLRLLARVFAPERFDIVLKALEHDHA
jgi:intracellular multiplication protein IcmW